MQDGRHEGPRPGSRPGAMTVAMRAATTPGSDGRQVLRVAVVRDGRIVAEHVVGADGQLTVGQSERCDVVLSDVAAPMSAVLLRGDSVDYRLDAAPVQGGRLQLPSGVVEVDGPHSSGELRLPPGSRGMLRVADVTLLLQRVAPRPDMPRPRLPAAVRGQVAASIDWLFTCMLSFSMMSAFGFMVYLQHMDFPLPGDGAAVPEQLAHYVFEEPTPPTPPTPLAPPSPMADHAPDPVTDDARAETPTPEPPSKRRTPRTPALRDSGEPDAAPSLARTDAIRQQAVAAASALMVGALGAADGALQDVLAAGAVPGRAADIFARAGAVQVARSDDGLLPTRRGPRGDGVSGSIGELQLAAAARTGRTRDEGGGPDERVIDHPPGHAGLGEGGDVAGSGDFAAARVVAAIKRKLGAIKACYERGLRRDPQLSGKLTMEFVVQPRGSVTGTRVTADTVGDAQVARCVGGVLGKLRFVPGPTGGSVTFAYPFVFSPQN